MEIALTLSIHIVMATPLWACRSVFALLKISVVTSRGFNKLEAVTNTIQLIRDRHPQRLPMGTSLIDQLIWAQEQLLGVLRDIQLVQRFSEMGLSGRVEELVMHLAQEVDPEGDCQGHSHPKLLELKTQGRRVHNSSTLSCSHWFPGQRLFPSGYLSTNLY